MDYSILNKVAVRVSIDSKPTGSGVILKNDNNIFIITAEHCIKNLKNNISIDFYNSSEGNFAQEELSKDDFEIIKSNDSKIDVVFIKIIASKSGIWIDSPEIKLVSNIFDEKKDFIFRGFPKAYENLAPANIEVSLVDQTNNSSFIIKPKNEKFDNSSYGYEQIMEGFSGSGVYFYLRGSIYLVGIVSKFIGEIIRFKAFEIFFAKSVLPEIRIYEKNDIPFEFFNIELLSDFKRQLEESENYIYIFKPETALMQLGRIENAIKKSLLPQKEKDKLLAESSFLRGIALISLEKPSSESSELVLNAYTFDSNIIKYKERAALVYYLLNEEDKSLELVKEVLKSEPFNARAWALKINLATDDVDVPCIVLEKPRFVYNRFIHSLKGKEIPTIEDLRESFGHISENVSTPTVEQIDFDNFLFYLFLSIYFLNDQNEKVRIKSRNKTQKIVSKKEEKGAEILEVLITKLARTEVEDTNLIKQASFYYELSKYKLNPTKIYALRLFTLFIENQLISQTLMKVFDIVFALLDFDLHEEVIQIIEKSEIELFDPNFYLIRAESLEKISKSQEAKNYYEKFVTEITNVDAVKLQNLLISIDALQKYEIENNLIHSYILNKTYLDEFAQNLLEGYIYRMDREKKEFSKSMANNVIVHWEKLHFNYKMAVVAIYCGIGELDKGIELFRPMLNGSDEELYLDQYIEILSLSKNYNKELLEKLEIWRLNFSPKVHFLLLELDLYRKIDNYQKIEEISKYGLEKFPEENRFKFLLIDVLYKQRKITHLEQYLDDSIFTFDFPSDNIFYLSHICIITNRVELGLELAYRQLKKFPLNNDIKMAYWGIMLKLKEQNLPINPEIVDFETIIELEVDEENDLYEISIDNYDSNPIIKSIFHKRVGDIIEYNVKFHKSKIKIITIYNKYIGEFQRIIREVNKPLSGGLPVKSMKILDENGEFNIEDFNKKLQEFYGENGLKNRIENEKIIENYQRKIIGFSQICNLLFDGNYFDCFEGLTTRPILGMNLIPLSQQNNYALTKETEFVLDFTSILLFQSLSEKIEFKDYNFYISQSTKDLIVKEIYELELSSKEKMELSILPNQVIPIVYPEIFLDNKLSKLNKILCWVEQNCKIDYIDLSLDNTDIFERLSSEVEKRHVEHTILISYKPNRILITDEKLYYSNPMVYLMSTENFFKSINYQIWEIAKLQMIGLNYKGLSLTSNTLYNAFEKSRIVIKNDQNLFQSALKNLEGEHNPNIKNIGEALKFIKDLFSINLDLPSRISLTKQIFIAIFKEPYFDISRENFKKISNMINREFYLLGDASEIVKRCLKEVLRNLQLIDDN